MPENGFYRPNEEVAIGLTGVSGEKCIVYSPCLNGCMDSVLQIYGLGMLYTYDHLPACQYREPRSIEDDRVLGLARILYMYPE
jgi:hypothetical protein